MSPRALLLSPTGVPGGAERALVALARRLPEHGISPSAVLLADGPLREALEHARCPVTVVSAGRTRHVARTFATIRTLADMAAECDVVVSNQSKGHVYGGAAARLARVPEIWWQHGMASRSRIELVAAAVHTSAIVCSSQTALDAQRRVTKRARVELIHPGTAIEHVRSFKGSGGAVRQEQGWDGRSVVGIVGRLEPWKGQETFLRAAARVARRHPDVRFVVVGGAVLGWEGSYPEKLAALAETLGIAQITTFTGHREDVYSWFDALDVVVNASFGEPFGLVLVEAMAMGKPVIATALAGPLEIIEDEISGLLVPAGDPTILASTINRLLEEPDLSSSLGEAASIRANLFSDLVMTTRFAALVSSVSGRAPEALPPDAMAGEGTHEAVVQMLDGAGVAPVVDLGAGLGAFSQTLRRRGHDAVAVGIAIEQFQATDVPYVAADLDAGLPFRSASLGGIVAIELLEHLEAPLRLLREAARCLRLKGWLILTTPNVLSLASKLSYFARDRHTYFGDDEFLNNGHISPVSLVDVARIASRCGLEIEDVTYNVGKLPVPRLRHRFPLRSDMFRNQLLGESLIVKLRKTGEPLAEIVRG